MKTFKKLRSEIKKKGSGIIPAPIHFRHVGSSPEGLEEAHIDSWIGTRDNNHIPRRASMESVLGSAENLNTEQKKSLRKYTTSSFKLNKDLIDNNTDEKQNEQVKHLDSAIDANRIKTRVHTYSGVSFDPTKHMDENGQLHSPAYISTSHDKETASRFSVPKDGIHHIIHLHIDANGPAMHVPEHISGLGEDEIILKRGTTLQHHGYTDYTHPHRTYRVHRMTVVNKE